MEWQTKTKDYTNKGKLWTNYDKWTIILQGKVNIDGNEQRIIGVKRKNSRGELITDIFTSIGTLKKNENCMKDFYQENEEGPPNSKGVVSNLIPNGTFGISAWKNERDGKPEVTLEIQSFNDKDMPVKDVNEDVENSVQNDPELNDEIPF
jgi:lipopolysaccharide export LptBFGC system permease protein LptF